MEMKLERDIGALGGIAKLSELLDRGHHPEHVRISCNYGRIIRVRKGWYARRDAPSDAILAWRVGGRLACVSALHYLGLLDRPAALHVAVRANASRLRAPRNARSRLDALSAEVVVHWVSDAGGDRVTVAPATALAQAAQCWATATTTSAARGRR